MISVLLPTRGRPDSLYRSIQSLMGLATDFYGRSFEVLLALDPDDPHAEAAHGVFNEMSGSGLPGMVWTAPERYGYSRLNVYFNALARLAKGDWLLLWNDDAVMTSPGWNSAIHALDERVIVADCWCPPHSPWLITFPAVRRWAVDVLGEFSRHTCHCDTYWEMIGRAIPGAAVEVHGARVFHDRNDLTGNHNDEVWREGQAGYQRGHFYSPEVQALIQKDIETLRAVHSGRFGGTT